MVELKVSVPLEAFNTAGTLPGLMNADGVGESTEKPLTKLMFTGSLGGL
jgi:hypothetical protein